MTHEIQETMKTTTIQQDVGVSQPTYYEYTEVFVWGEDRNGQLGIDSQLKLKQTGNKRPDFIQIPRSCSFNIVITQVACGEDHSGIVTSQGHLYMMGSNKMGQLGVVNAVSPMQACQQLIDETPEEQYRVGSPCLVEALKNHTVLQVSCGRDFTLAIGTPPRSNPD